ncbi:PAS domain S-box protein [Bosea caraganae]|uniref:histidine kinase n=1 Tax=Bosea caraganae TaxID=2763117 RepID=A0A370L3D9_9HYPH|nr:PAS domain-containing protein [Bosea caraganae]RDJ20857.1 PAS domain S-box protein [Bosea caraganae]RDJ22610.1 PAS domain S-box protein [Bosea caraganae]
MSEVERPDRDGNGAGETSDRLAAELARLRSDIRDAEHRLHLTLDAAGATGGWVWDIPNKVLTGDARFAALTSQDPAEMVRGVPTSRFFANIAADDQKRIRLAVAGILAGAEVFSKDYRLVKGDGTMRWVHASGKAILSQDDLPLKFIGDLVDITEQKRVQEQLRIAQSAGAIGTFEHARGFGTVTVSEQFCRLLGLHPTRILPVATVNQLVHPADRPIIEPILPEQPRPDSNIEFRITRADTGEHRWLTRRGEYVRDLSGPGLRYIGVAYDITASKLNEERLKRLNEGLSESVKERTRDRDRIWQNSRDMLAVTDQHGRILDANPAWPAILGIEFSDLVGRGMSELAWPDDAELVRGNFVDTLREGSAAFESRIKHAEGTPRWVSWTASRESETIYLYGRHVTREKEQESALREAEAQLRQSQKMEAVGQLTGGIAHDFNNMLTGIMGALDIIKRRLASGRLEGVERFMDAATASAQRAAGLTHRLLAFSRRQPLDRKPVDVRQLILDMRELLDRSLGEQVELRVQPSPDCWAAVTDANQLENALLNLAINARDAMPDGGQLSIETHNIALVAGEMPGLIIQGKQDFVAITVRDTGVGMSAEVLEKVFEPFFTTKPIGQGTGLGLSMVYGFTQQSGGGVDIKSKPAQGTAITLYLPRSPAESQIDVRRGSPVPQGAGESVLVVEDDSSVRLLVVEVLRDLGYSAIEAVNADLAIEKLRQNDHFDLMISDVGLPGMNGRQLAEVARDIHPGLKVLFITGYAANAINKNEFLADGMDMISKPFDLEQLARKIREMLAVVMNTAVIVPDS